LEVAGQSVLVIGTKRSGLGAIELLRSRGACVRAMDAQAPTAEERARFDQLQIRVVPQTDENILEDGRAPDLIVLSPAVPGDLPMLQRTRDQGIPIIGEVELASYYLKGPVIGITGTNGKTTTTALTGHLLEKCGIPCQVGGNIGTAVTSLVASSAANQWNVFELSSFQLESISNFSAQIAVCLNISPDHLDRHHTFENYVAAKRRLFETQKQTGCAVLNYDDQVCREYARSTPGAVYWFSSSRCPPTGVSMCGEELCWNNRPFMRRSQIKLRGTHNLENVMAATAAAHLAGADLGKLGDAVSSFPGVEHRIEFVRSLAGVDYYNDSKATNVDAALKAIGAFQNLWIILGGKDKGSDYSPLREPLQARAKAVLLIGAEPPYAYAAGPLIRQALDGSVAVVPCGTLEHALAFARRNAAPGDTVLLSPACASFDQFQNYEERGRTFKHLVAELS
jgi:UDP-N-acetylmuramoylalanine--D-glutamate ligase